MMKEHPTGGIRLVYLDDSEDDAYLIKRLLSENMPDAIVSWVPDRKQYIALLEEIKPDAVLCDYTLPGYTPEEALADLNKIAPNTPFILVSGVASEEIAVEIMRRGAQDYLSKDRLQRLPQAIRNAVLRNTAEKERVRTEANLRTIFENTTIAFLLLDRNLKVVSFNSEAIKRYKSAIGASLEVGADARNYVTPDRHQLINAQFREVLSGSKISYEISFPENGSVIWYSVNMLPVTGTHGSEGIIISSEDITHKKRNDLERDRLLARIAGHNKNLEQFAYMVSHDLRAPVAQLIGLSNLLKNDAALTAAERDKCLSGLTDAANRVDHAIRDLSTALHRRRESRMPMEAVSVSATLEEIKNTLAPILQEKNAVVETHLTHDSLQTVKSFLYSILFNLITNSIKYCKPNTPVKIEIDSVRDDTHIVISYRDNGQGIDLARHGKRIFGLRNRFSSNEEGEGIGLFMVKAQVELLGGTIAVNSTPGTGTEFTIRLMQ